MSLGGPSLATYRKDDPAGSGALVSTAEGIGESPAGRVVLGIADTDPYGSPFQFTSGRVLELGNFPLIMSNAGGPNGPESVTVYPGTVAIFGDVTQNGDPNVQFSELSTGGGGIVTYDSINSAFKMAAGNLAAVVALFPGTGNMSLGNIFDAGIKLFIDGVTRVNGVLLAQTPVKENPAALEPVLFADGRTIFSNTGNAGGLTQYNLPTAVTLGMDFSFCVEDPLGILINPDAADTIILGGYDNGAGAAVSSYYPGSVVRLVCTKFNQWTAVSVTGSWSF